MAKKILVVDDDILVTKTLSRYLKSNGYEIDTANSGEEAIKKSETYIFDLILVDMRMPMMDGIETIKRLRAVCQNKHKIKIPEIIITGYASDEKEAEADALGVLDYIYKPFDIDKFIEAIRKILKD